MPDVEDAGPRTGSFKLLEDEFSDLEKAMSPPSDPVRLAGEFLSGENIYGKTFLTPTLAKLFMALDVLHASYPWCEFDRIPKTWGHTLTSVDGKGRTGVLDMLTGKVDTAPEPEPPQLPPLR